MSGSRMPRRSPWRHLPNAFSVARIACVPLLVALALLGHASAYAWTLVFALLSDVVDGWMARGLHFETPLGARLDSIGDTLVWYAVLVGIVLLQRDVLADHWALIGTVAGAWALENLLAWRRYGRLSSFHTYASKVAGVLLSVYACVLFVLGHQPWLLYLASAASLLANAEEFVLLWLCPEWRSNVRGGWWVWNERRKGTERIQPVSQTPANQGGPRWRAEPSDSP